ncbi:MAG TPA: sulfite exporter TauE/SafE family protein [Candidatus Acidoferrum sp.]|nr:sulfite exporter TauE/SafE family protein [Candidatus Acidoferrum sp.]
MDRRAVFAAIGFLGGLLGGLLGVGGGFVLIPLQVLWAGVPQRNANANSIVAILPIAVAALPIYYFRTRTPQIDLRVGLFLVIGSVVGAYLGARLLKRIPDRELKLAVVVILGLVGVKQLLLP